MGSFVVFVLCDIPFYMHTVAGTWTLSEMMRSFAEGNSNLSMIVGAYLASINYKMIDVQNVSSFIDYHWTGFCSS